MDIQGCQANSNPARDQETICSPPIGNDCLQIIQKQKLSRQNCSIWCTRKIIQNPLWGWGCRRNVPRRSNKIYKGPPIKTSSTRFQQIEHEYWTAQQSGRHRSPRIETLSVVKESCHTSLIMFYHITIIIWILLMLWWLCCVIVVSILILKRIDQSICKCFHMSHLIYRLKSKCTLFQESH